MSYTDDVGCTFKALQPDVEDERTDAEKQANLDQQRAIFDEVIKDFAVPLRGLAK